MPSCTRLRGETDRAIQQVGDASTQSDQLLAVEPTNSKWIERAAQSRHDMAEYVLAKGNLPAATAEARSSCGLSDSLYAKDATVADWRMLRRDCLSLQAKIALASGHKPQAVAIAREAVNAAKSVDGTDPVADRNDLGTAYRILGDAERAAGHPAAAHDAWTAGLAAIPATMTGPPSEMSVHQALLQRLGRTAEAAQLASKLSAVGYREPEYRSASN